MARKPQKCLSCGAVVAKGDAECAVCGHPVKEPELDTLMKAFQIDPSKAPPRPTPAASDGAEILSLCGNCGAFVDARAKTCDKCGTDLGVEEEIEAAQVVPEEVHLSSSTILCPECGAAMTQGMERCGVCGADLEPAGRLSAPVPTEPGHFCDNCGAELAADGHCPLCTAIDAITARATVSSRQAAEQKRQRAPDLTPPPPEPVQAADIQEAEAVEARFSSFLRPRAKPATPPTLLAPVSEAKPPPVVHAPPPKSPVKELPPLAKPAVSKSPPPTSVPPPARVEAKPAALPPPKTPTPRIVELPKAPAPSVPAKGSVPEKEKKPAKAPPKAPEKPIVVIPPPPGTPSDEDLELPEEIPAYSTFTFGLEDTAKKPTSLSEEPLTEEEASEVALAEALDELEEVVDSPSLPEEPPKIRTVTSKAETKPPKKRPPKERSRPPPPIEALPEIPEEASEPAEIQVWGDEEVPQETAESIEGPVVARSFSRNSLVAPRPPKAVSTRLLRLGEMALYATVFCLAAGLVVGRVPTPDRGVILLALFGVNFGVAVMFLIAAWRGISRRGRWAGIAGSGAVLLAIAPVIAVLGLPVPFLLQLVLLLAGTAILLGGTWQIAHPGGVYVPWAGGVFVLFFQSLVPFVFTSPATDLDLWVWLFGSAAILAAAAMAAQGRLVGSRVSAAVERTRPMHEELYAEASISKYDRALALGRRTATGTGDEAWTSKGAALVLLGRYDEAIECLDQALQINPDSELAWLNRGNALARKGLTKDALSAYNRAIQANSRYEVAWNNKGNTLARLGNHAEALRCYDRAIELDGGYRSAWVNKGFVLAKMGYYEEAAQCADKVLSITGKASAVP